MQLQALTKDVPGHELERAKRAATASILMNLESRAIVVEDIGRQLLTYDRRCAPPPPSTLAPPLLGDTASCLLPLALQAWQQSFAQDVSKTCCI